MSRSKRQTKPTMKFLSYIEQGLRWKRLSDSADETECFLGPSVTLRKLDAGKLGNSNPKDHLFTKQPRKTTRQHKIKGQVREYLSGKAKNEELKKTAKDGNRASKLQSSGIPIIKVNSLTENNENETCNELNNSPTESNSENCNSSSDSEADLELSDASDVNCDDNVNYSLKRPLVSPDQDGYDDLPKKLLKKSDLKQTNSTSFLSTNKKVSTSSQETKNLPSEGTDLLKDLSNQTRKLSNITNKFSNSTSLSRIQNFIPKLNKTSKSMSNLDHKMLCEEASDVKQKDEKISIEESLKTFISTGKTVANAISDTLQSTNNFQVFKSSSKFELKCLSVVRTLAERSKDLKEEDMEEILKLLDEEQNERKLFQKSFLESLRVSHLTNMALYNQMYRLLKTL